MHRTEIKPSWETLPLMVTVSDTCDPNALTSIEVFSDEAPLTDKYEHSAVLGRIYNGNQTVGAPLAGWTLTLSRKYATKSAMVNKDFAAPDPDGRFYTVRVCATDLAGNVGCNETSTGVPRKDINGHMFTPGINSGKLYSLASDLVYWASPQTDIPFRLKNTGLNQ